MVIAYLLVHRPLFGEYDRIAKLEGPDMEAVGTTILPSVRTIPGVVATKTLAGASR